MLKLRPVIVRDYVRHDVNLRPLIEHMALEALLLEHGNTTWDASEVLACVRIVCVLFFNVDFDRGMDTREEIKERKWVREIHCLGRGRCRAI